MSRCMPGWIAVWVSVVGVLWAVPDVSGSLTPAPLRFASMYGSHMVLQAAPLKANVWGFGEANSTVVLSLSTGGAGMSQTATVGPDLVWRVTLDPTAASCSDAYVIKITDGKNPPVMLEDVLFGDTYVAGGQSNMQFVVNQGFGAKEEIANAGNYPCIRLFTAALNQSSKPEVDLLGVAQPWSVASPDSVGGGGKAWSHISATAWYFAKNTFIAQQRPIGMLVSCWGGTTDEAWSSPAALAKCGLAADTTTSPQDQLPLTRLQGPKAFSVLWNAMIVPLLSTTIRGAIWYQGEADSATPTEANNYACTFPAMIADWRARWSAKSGTTNATFPFGFVMLSTWHDTANDTSGGNVPVVRYGQTGGFGYVPNPKMPNVFMAQAQDLGDPGSPFGDIHPRYKAQVGARLALSAQNAVYGNSSVYWTGPIFVSAQVATIPVPNGSTAVTIQFRDVGEGGIYTTSRDKGFQLGYGGDAGTWAYASIVSSATDTVTIMANITAPTGTTLTVRYEWRGAPCAPAAGPYGCTVYSHQNQLPSAPFNATVLPAAAAAAAAAAAV